jgi:hypothetical protein
MANEFKMAAKLTLFSQSMKSNCTYFPAIIFFLEIQNGGLI